MYIRIDPDGWRPDERNVSSASTSSLEPGNIVIWERKPFRVIKVRTFDPVDWTEKQRERWVADNCPDAATWYRRPMALVLRPDDLETATPIHLGGPASVTWRTLPEHYAVCHACKELPPCTHLHNEAVMERASEQMAVVMALMPGACHGCHEPITQRQKTFLFPGPNVIRPDFGDDTAIFHTRKSCSYDLRSYDKRWAKAATGRTAYFNCAGNLTTHYDDSQECTNPACPATVVPANPLADLVEHQLSVWHHPNVRAGHVAAGCWCLVGAEPVPGPIVYT